MYRPLFILCPGRSFSSVVCTAIGQHPELYDVPEIYLALASTVGELLQKATEPGKKYLAYGLVRVIAQLHHSNQHEESALAAWAWLRQNQRWSTQRLYHYLASKIAPQRLVDKSPSHGRLENLERLYAAFPDAYFLHLIRHPRPTGSSLYKVHFERLARREPKKLAGLAKHVEQQWLKVHSNILHFTAQLPPGRSMRIQGEDLLAAPDSYLRQIAEWLDIGTDRASIDAMMHPERSPYAQPGPPSAPYGNNQGFLENPQLRVGRPTTGRLEGALEWSDAGDWFSPETIMLARQFGYR